MLFIADLQYITIRKVKSGCALNPKLRPQSQESEPNSHESVALSPMIRTLQSTAGHYRGPTQWNCRKTTGKAAGAWRRSGHARHGDTAHFECGNECGNECRNECGNKVWGRSLIWCGGMMWWYDDMARFSRNIEDRTTITAIAITEQPCPQRLLPNSHNHNGHGRNSHQVEPAALKVCWVQNESRTGNHEAFRPASALCFGRESNPYGHCCPQDFKSCVSTNSTTKAKRVQKYLNFT